MTYIFKPADDNMYALYHKFKKDFDERPTEEDIKNVFVNEVYHDKKITNYIMTSDNDMENYIMDLKLAELDYNDNHHKWLVRSCL